MLHNLDRIFNLDLTANPTLDSAVVDLMRAAISLALLTFRPFALRLHIAIHLLLPILRKSPSRTIPVL